MAGKPASRFPPCGARTKTYCGRPCEAPPVVDRNTGQPRNGRCRLHGGLSTGPKKFSDFYWVLSWPPPRSIFWRFCVAHFCRKTFCGRHTISLVEVLAWQANPLLDFLRAVLAPSYSVGDRAGRRPSSIEALASQEMGAAGCTAGFRPAQKRLEAKLGRWQPYAPDGWRGGSGKARVLSEFSWRSSELGCQTRPKQAVHF